VTVFTVGVRAQANGAEATGPKQAEMSVKDLDHIVQFMEDPVKRDAFIKDLRALIQADALRRAEVQEPPRSAERLFIAGLLRRLEAFFRDVIRSAEDTVSLVATIPGGAVHLFSDLSQSENRTRFLGFLAAGAGGILVSLFIALVLRRRKPFLIDPGRGALARIFRGCLRVVADAAPYGTLLVALLLLFPFAPSFPRAQALVFLFALLLFLYRLALSVLTVLLSPEDGGARMLSLSDENAHYFWVWAVRFGKYGAFYFAATGTLTILDAPTSSYLFLRSLLLILFPLMMSVFILQVAREGRTRCASHLEKRRDPGGRRKRLERVAIRYWPVPALGYVWAVFFFLIVHYSAGFDYLLDATLWSAVTVGAVVVCLEGLEFAFGRLFAFSALVKLRFPGLEERTDRYVSLVRKVVRYLLVISGAGVIAHVWGIPVSTFVASEVGATLILRFVGIGITIGAAAILMETSQFICDRILEERDGVGTVSKKKKTLCPLINNTVKIASVFIGGVVVLDQLGVNTGPILAGAGIIGLAVGFGAQSLVKDVINGLFILFEDLISVGDVAVLKGKSGVVESVGLRTVRLRDAAGNVHVVPNSDIDLITNMTKDFSMYVFEVGVAYREDVDEVMSVLREIGADLQNDLEYGKDILEPLEVLGVDSFADSAVIIKARFKTKPVRQWAVGREFNRRMKKVFDARGIEIPFPHRTIYWGEPKAGPAPPLQVQLEGPKGGHQQTT
jgi:small conductance mechanosensitive channel